VGATATLAVFSCSGMVLAATDPYRSDLPLERRREIMHVSPLEAAHKAATLARVSRRAQAATANQQAYDVHYYNLDIDVDPVSHVITGTVRVVATVTAGPLSTLELDLQSGAMSVTSASLASGPATFTHSSDVLAVALDRPYATGETVQATVHYQGTPVLGDFVGPFVFMQRGVKLGMWTVSEPYGAHAWWPCKDQQDDKADSVDIRISVPSGMKTASNGVRVESTDDGVHAVTRWKVRYPIATYLVSMASFAYTTWSDWYRYTPTDSMEIQFYIYPDQVTTAQTVTPLVKNMLAAYVTRFGPYPFLNEKYGMANTTMGGGMENQTCTSLGSFAEYVVCHELSHQWWGDLVTARDFHHVWLHEGFATYSQALWAEATGGSTAYHDDLGFNKYFGPGTVYCPTLTPDRIFDSDLSYDKASWVLHMLRHVLGDATFFQALQTYAQQFRYANATTEDFQAVCEQVSGRSLAAFFAEWIYGEYYPQYQFAYGSQASSNGYDVTVQIQQVQTGQRFWMPLDVRIQTASGSQTFVVPDSLPLQLATFHVNDAPLGVQLDPDEWVLRTVQSVANVGSPPVSERLELLARPNPCRDGAELAFSLPRAGPARLALLDVSGRTIAELQNGPLAAGRHTLRWSGHDDRGRVVTGGVYWLCLEQGGARRVERIAVVR
jgi:aminopeptidase N